MRIKNNINFSLRKQHSGVSLVELIAFIIIVGIASSALFSVYNSSLLRSADPIIQTRALEAAQAKLDEILALKYDENTPTGGIPACSSGAPEAVACNNLTDANMNDVDDYNGVTDVAYIQGGLSSTAYNRSVTVTALANEKLISVTVTAPNNWSVTLAAYKANF